MIIRFACEHCGARLNVGARKAGTRAKCPKCERSLIIPAVSDDAAKAAAPKRPVRATTAPGEDSAATPATRPPAAAAPAAPAIPREPREAAPPGAAADVGRVPETEAPRTDEAPAKPRVASVPTEAVAEPAARPTPSLSVAPAPATMPDPFAQFVVYDDDSELVYAPDDDDRWPAAEAASVDPTKVAVARSILYLQGVLLGLVGLAGLGLGFLLGRSGMTRPVETAGPQPCVVTGVAAFRNGQEAPEPDRGAVAIVVPQAARPEERIAMDGLLPHQPPPGENNAGVAAIRRVGGDYGRADSEGRFHLRVPDRGLYFLLVISGHKSQREGDAPKSALAQMGRFFRLTPEMFAGHAFCWQEETVQRDRQVNVVFQ